MGNPGCWSWTCLMKSNDMALKKNADINQLCQKIWWHLNATRKGMRGTYSPLDSWYYPIKGMADEDTVTYTRKELLTWIDGPFMAISGALDTSTFTLAEIAELFRWLRDEGVIDFPKKSPFCDIDENGEATAGGTGTDCGSGGGGW